MFLAPTYHSFSHCENPPRSRLRWSKHLQSKVELSTRTLRQAIKGIKVKLMLVTYTLGRRTLGLVLPPVEATTDAKGDYRLDKLPPGNYILELDSPETEAKVAEAEAKVLEPEPDDPPARKSAYRQEWWPSGSRLELSQTISLSAGVQLTLPDIRISKEPLFRISGLVNSGNCAGGDPYDVFLTRQYGTMYITDAQAPVRCGSAFTITNLAPGDYQISARLHSSHSGGPVAWEAATVIDRDVRRDLSAGLPLMIPGTMTFPDSFKAGKLPLFLGAEPLWGVGLGSPQSFPIARADNSFVVILPSSRPVQLKLTGLEAPYYISDLLYSGSSAPDGVFTPQPYAAGQSLKIIVSDDSGGVQGTVSDGDAVVPEATVVIVPWPLRRPSDFPVHFLTTTDQSGAFKLAGLPPGTYRMLSVSSAAWETQLQKPGVVDSLAADCQSVSIGSGMTASVSLDLKHVSMTP